MAMVATKRHMAALRTGVVTLLLGLATFQILMASFPSKTCRYDDLQIPEGHSLPQYQPENVATDRLRRSCQYSLNFILPIMNCPNGVWRATRQGGCTRTSTMSRRRRNRVLTARSKVRCNLDSC